MVSLRSGVLSWVLGMALVAAGGVAEGKDPFPRPAGIESQVAFWKDVFAVHSQNQAVIHDERHLDIVYGVIDLPPLPEAGRPSRQLLVARRDRADAEKKRIVNLLRHLHRHREAGSLSPQEREIWELFRDVNAPDKFLQASRRVRWQTGLRERFREGLRRSGRYLPIMEEIFREEGLPVELTRLPLVESSFDQAAYSHRGAAGIWQFIPGSARIYRLRMDEIADERRDPLRATRAAARHLRDDFEMLQSWPLAVTAYNHGRHGVARAVREVGSKDLVDIIRNYSGRRFGFASRNFYAEFLAALDVERNAGKFFGPVEREEPGRFDEVTLRDYVPFPTLARLADVPVDELRALNPGLRAEVTEGKLRFPPGYMLRVPGGRGEAFHKAYAELGPGERFDRQRLYFVRHQVRPGETVSGIAARYGTSARSIQRANGLSSVHRIRAGQTLKVPPRTAGGAVARATPGDSIVRHQVRQGQTLESIARSYGTSIRAIQRSNGLENIDMIRAGQVLEVPTGKRSDGTYVLHRVRAGQTVDGIARRYGTTIDAIELHNELGNADRIYPGQVIRVPSADS